MGLSAAILCSEALSRIYLLGAEPKDIRRAMLRTASDDRGIILSDLIVSRSAGQRLPASLKQHVEELLEGFGDDPLNVLSYVIDSAKTWPDVAPWFPRDLFYNARLSDTDPPLGLDLADSHLHSSASLCLDDFCVLLASSQARIDDNARTMITYDSTGSPYSFGTVAAAFRTFVQFRQSGITGRSLLGKPNATAAIEAGTFWESVRRLALHDGEEANLVPSLWDELAASAIAPTVGLIDVEKVVRRELNDAHKGQLQARRNCLGLFGCIVLINRQLRSHPGEGVSRFVDRFRMLGLARDALVRHAQAELVATACHRNLGSPAVVAAEFRKSFVGANGSRDGDVLAHLRQSLVDHLEGFALFLKATGSAKQLSMPVGFIRDRTAVVAPHNCLPAVHRLSGTWRVAQALALLLEEQVARKYIRSVDLAGDEMGAGSWPYVAAVDEIRRRAKGRVRLAVTVHAGESFRWELQGVRFVGELVVPVRRVDRIGHALSLDEDVAGIIVGSGPSMVDTRSVIDDLCWLIHAGIKADEAAEFLDRVLAKVQFDELDLDRDDLVKAWLSRWSWRELAEATGSTVDDFPASTSWIPDYLSRGLRSFDDPRSRALIALCYRGQGTEAVLDRSVGADLSDEFLEWSTAVAPVAREVVKSAIRDKDVVVEACPTSNMRLSGLRLMKHLPLHDWCESGMRVSLNSDDPLIFGHTVADEAAAVQRAFSTSLVEAMAKTSVDTCGNGLRPQGSRAYANAASALGSAWPVDEDLGGGRPSAGS
jgi:Adenosine deaminase